MLCNSELPLCCSLLTNNSINCHSHYSEETTQQHNMFLHIFVQCIFEYYYIWIFWHVVIYFSERLKEMTATVNREWNAVLSAYKHHSISVTVDRLCVATALRPSIAHQMAALEQLSRQLQTKYLFC